MLFCSVEQHSLEIERAERPYASAAASDNTLKAYAKDWAHFARWCRMRGADPLPPSPELVGLYIADLAAPQGHGPTKPPALSVE
jgi:site-specific recombinase XerD